MSPFHQIDGGVGWLESRGDTTWRANTNSASTGNGLFQTATNTTTQQQQMFFNDLRFAAAKSIRTSTIILATFNTIAAFATAIGILIDAYYRERRNNKKYKFSRNGFAFVPAVEVFPLVLSVGIIVQGITFAVAQSTGLDSLVGAGCTLVAQLMLPAVFIVPYTQLIFGLEIMMRGLKKQPFAPRGKWSVTICLTIIGLLILTNFLVANFDRSPNFCLTSLFWFVGHYSTGCFALLTGICATLLVCTIVVFVKLHRSTKIEVTERVAASRMVYYMALGAISSGFMLPYFYVMSFVNQKGGQGNALTLSMVASVVANVSGLMTGGLYLFLKSNTLSTIGPRDKIGEYENRRLKYKIRRYGASDPDFDSHMMEPVTGPGSLRRMDSDASLSSIEKVEDTKYDESGRPPSLTYDGPNANPLRPNAVHPTQPPVPRAPEPAMMSAMSSINPVHMRKRSYSLFPSAAPSIKSVTLLPATTYSPNNNYNESAADTLKPPPSMRNLVNRHRRDSSLISSATVQIGLRLSSVEDMLPTAESKVVNGDANVYTLDCPNLVSADKPALANKRPTALTALDTNIPILRPEEPVVDESPSRDPVKNARMKTLPPVPMPGQAPVEPSAANEVAQDDNAVMLSPSVYSPTSPTKARLPSPKGVGFILPATKFNGGSMRSPKSPPMATPRRRAAEDDTVATTPRLPNANKGDWI
ncbi:hypothetical protein B0T17DRAFT_361363 [Bombardia bombarda]|uniref:Uncharacterized protein n=1 Tax=Bombardia bombarda TaxID=252184 RepID=A0AA40BW94_9PEZI|nr:hypothetical protein B0T17DRAFT_361363 [Bombardia bombarda]